MYLGFLIGCVLIFCAFARVGSRGRYAAVAVITATLGFTASMVAKQPAPQAPVGVAVERFMEANGSEILGFFLFSGLGATIGAVLWRPPKREYVSVAVRQCPFCAEIIQAKAVVCKHCHRDLPQATAAGPGVPAESPSASGA
jgi:hypothetical protein